MKKAMPAGDVKQGAARRGEQDVTISVQAGRGHASLSITPQIWGDPQTSGSRNLDDFEKLRSTKGVNVHLCATNVETGKVRIFNRNELSADTVLASACLPFLFQTIQIDGANYWDGGYIGNPAIFPIIYNSKSCDVVIVHINPIVRHGVPKTAPEILNRINEISFNSSLMREMRAIALTESTVFASLLGTLAPLMVGFFARTAFTWRGF